MLFTQANYRTSQAEFKRDTELATDAMYSEMYDKVHTTIQENLATCTRRAIKLRAEGNLPKELGDGMIGHDDLVKLIKELELEGDDKTNAYLYANLVRRHILLNNLVKSKVKLKKIARDTLLSLVRAELRNGNKVTLGELVHITPFKADKVLGRGDNILLDSPDTFDIDELRLQLINELVEMDLIDLRFADKTHMVDIPKTFSRKVEQAEWKRLHKVALFLQKKTIWTEVPDIDESNMITQSSWFYRTPTLSPDQLEYIQVMQSIKYQFVEDAEDRITDAYKVHLKEDTLPEWAIDRVEFFKEQIRASHANGGHYCSIKLDSATRTYVMAELGSKQTSPALRALVKIADVKNPVKYDMKNNVIQMYSIGLKSKNLGTYVQLVEDTLRKDDVRRLIADEVNIAIEDTCFNKDNMKPLFMVWAYNAGKNRILDGVTNVEEGIFGISTSVVKVPGMLEISGAANTEANRDILWKAFMAAIVKYVPEILIIKKVFEKIIKHNPLNIAQWTLPDGAIAQYASATTTEKTLYWVCNGGKQRQHTHHRKQIETDARAAGLLPRTIHSIDAYFARQLVLRAAKLGITVVPNHDSFTFDEEYYEIILTLVKTLFTELLESDILGGIVKQLNVTNGSLAVRDSNNKFITDELIWEKFGKLTVDDIAVSMPMELEA